MSKSWSYNNVDSAKTNRHTPSLSGVGLGHTNDTIPNKNAIEMVDEDLHLAPLLLFIYFLAPLLKPATLLTQWIKCA